MPKFSKNSLDKLETCHKKLQFLFNEVIKEKDCIVLCGHRGREEQEKAFAAGNSKLHFPRSKHNTLPSRAVDVVPYHDDIPHIHWSEIPDFINFADYVKEKAKEMNIKIIWGGDWHSFKDYPHFELDATEPFKED